MPHIDERIIAGLTVRIDRTLCVGFGDCVTAAPDTFELDEEGIAVFRSPLPEVERALLLEACGACPVDALTVLDASGRQLAP
jgi:ferredoxin